MRTSPRAALAALTFAGGCLLAGCGADEQPHRATPNAAVQPARPAAPPPAQPPQRPARPGPAADQPRDPATALVTAAELTSRSSGQFRETSTYDEQEAQATLFECQRSRFAELGAAQTMVREFDRPDGAIAAEVVAVFRTAERARTGAATVAGWISRCADGNPDLDPPSRGATVTEAGATVQTWAMSSTDKATGVTLKEYLGAGHHGRTMLVTVYRVSGQRPGVQGDPYTFLPRLAVGRLG